MDSLDIPYCLQYVILFACPLDTVQSRPLGTGQALRGAATLRSSGLAPFLFVPLQWARYDNFIPLLAHKCRRDPTLGFKNVLQLNLLFNAPGQRKFISSHAWPPSLAGRYVHFEFQAAQLRCWGLRPLMPLPAKLRSLVSLSEPFSVAKLCRHHSGHLSFSPISSQG